MIKMSFTELPEAKQLVVRMRENARNFPQKKLAIVETISKSLAKEVKHVLEAGQVKDPSLSKAYLEHKNKQGLDSRVGIATREYVDSIKASRTTGGWGVECADASKALHLEFGTRTQPPRQHWGPAFDKVRKGIAPLLKEKAFEGKK